MAKEVKREIKFRAWSRENKIMVTCNQVPVGMLNKYDDPVMQFTGLKDKNGKEIYEGDIVRQGVVEFKFGKWLIVNKQDDLKTKILYDTIHDTNEQEIIGNIYENPNLLTN